MIALSGTGDSPLKVCHKVQGGNNDGRPGSMADAVGGGDEKSLFVLHIGCQVT
jgi:hypothetical protein